MLRLELELSKANAPRRLFVERFRRYDRVIGADVKGVQARIGWLWLSALWGPGPR